MDDQKIIAKTVECVKKILADAEGGHDGWHIQRVWETAKHRHTYVENFLEKFYQEQEGKL